MSNPSEEREKRAVPVLDVKAKVTLVVLMSPRGPEVICGKGRLQLVADVRFQEGLRGLAKTPLKSPCTARE